MEGESANEELDEFIEYCRTAPSLALSQNQTGAQILVKSKKKKKPKSLNKLIISILYILK